MTAAPASGQAPTLTVVSAATFQRDSPLAPDMLASAFTAEIPRVSASATSTALPTELAGYSVVVTDSARTERLAPLVAVSAGQINFVVPAATTPGAATITVRNAGRALVSAPIQIGRLAPGLFTANANGSGPPAGFALTVLADGSRRLAELFETNSAGGFLARAFDLTEAGSQVFLLLFGTGLRGHGGNVTATAGVEPVPVLGAVAQGSFAGLDQVNLGPVPLSLDGRRGEVEVRLALDGTEANRVTIAPTPPAGGGWGRRRELIEANSEMAVADSNGKIYVIGGYPSNRVTTAAVQVYDPATDQWSLTTPLPTPLNHLMAVSANGKLYAIGGQTTDAGAGNFVDTVYEYDPAAAAWTPRAPMPTARGGGAAAVLDGRIYVAGGRPPRGSDFAVYDPRQNVWTALPDLPTQRNHLAAAAIGGKVFVIGGRFGAGFNSELTDRVEIFDPASGTWRQGAPMPRPRGGVNAVEAHGCIHVFGGEGASQEPNGVFPDHDVYDHRANVWTKLNRMPVPVHGVTGAAFLDGLIYLPGGGTAQGGSSGGRQHQVYRPVLACR